MNIKVYNQDGSVAGEMELSKTFNIPMNKDLLHQVVTSQEANLRPTVAHTKNRAEVRGGGKKPWRQKGTGRARHGSIRSPIWKGGGVTHGPLTEKDYSKKINKKMASKALAIALGAKAREGDLVLMESLSIPDGKTKAASLMIQKLASNKELARLATKSKAVILSNSAAREAKAFRNIEKLEVVAASQVTALDILRATAIVMTKDSVSILEKRIG